MRKKKSLSALVLINLFANCSFIIIGHLCDHKAVYY